MAPRSNGLESVKVASKDRTRALLAPMLSDDSYATRAAAIVQPELFPDPFRSVLEIVTGYVSQYQKAPGAHVKDLFDTWAENRKEEDAELVGDAIESLVRESRRAVNTPYLLDELAKHVNRIALAANLEKAQRLVDAGKHEEAQEVLAKHRPAVTTSNDITPIFSKAEEIRSAFEDDAEVLFTLPRSLGRVMGDDLKREHLIGILAPEKRGKTFFLNELGCLGFEANRNVLVVGLGDMSKGQTLTRLGIRIAGRSNRERYCQNVIEPIMDCADNQAGKCLRSRPCKGLAKGEDHQGTPIELYALWESGTCSGHQVCTRCRRSKTFRPSIWWRIADDVEPLTWRQAWREGERYVQRQGKAEFRLGCFPTKTVNVRKITAMIDAMEAVDGWVPDIVVLDYAEILAPEDARAEKRDQYDENWAAMRALSLKRKCLVIVGTQAPARAYSKVNMDMSDFSEDKRKNAHVTGMYALNQTPDEKRARIMRIGPVVYREGEWFQGDQATIAQCLAKGKAISFSL